MEALSATLQGMQADSDWKKILAPSPTSTEADETPAPLELACPRCRGARFLRRDVEVGDPDFGKLVRCDCARAIEAAQLGARLTVHQRSQTFPRFLRRAGTEGALAAAQEFAEDPEESWLVLLGVPGTGKSHLLAAIANRLIERRASPLYWTALHLLGWLREGFADGAEPPYAARLKDLEQRPILILDDVGAENTTPWVAERWQDILDARYSSRLPTVVSSNLTLDQIEEQLGLRIASRLRDSRLCRIRGLGAEDIRPQLATVERALAPAPIAKGASA